jgi:hypothetical protein
VALPTTSLLTSLARSTKPTGVEIQHSRPVTSLRRRERLAFTQALAQTKNRQNQAKIPRVFDVALNVKRKLAAETW